MTALRFDTDRRPQERGYVMLAALILIAIGAIITATALKTSSTAYRTQSSVQTRSDEYYTAEQTLNSGQNWLRQNSTALALSFIRTLFYEYFDRSAPSVGVNDTGEVTVPTKIKVRGSNNSVILAKGSGLPSSTYPVTTDAESGNSVQPSTMFTAGSYGDDLVRITLVDAVPIEPAKDFGDTDTGAPLPQTDFQPVFRIDSMETTGSGSHIYGYFLGTLTYNYGVGFYGKNFVDLRQSCDSYLSNNGAYNANSNRRSNCPIGSDGSVSIHSGEVVYGTVRTKGDIEQDAPYGGLICADFISGCPNKGMSCSGANCPVPGLPVYSTWATYCPVSQGNINANNNSTLLVAGNNPIQKCWDTVTIAANKSLTLKTTAYSYFLDTIDLSNNGQIKFQPDVPTGTINLYVRRFVGDKFNGNQVFNLNNKPYQLRLHYLGTQDLTLNGTADMSVFLIAPYANVTIQGTFTYNGGIKGLGITLTGSGKLHYDESGDITTIADVTFEPKNVVQRYK